MTAQLATDTAPVARASWPERPLQPQRALARLGDTLAAMSADQVMALAARAGVPARVAGRLAIGFTISADHFLKLCAAAGFDPVTGASCPSRRIGALDRALLGAGMRICRGLRRESVRAAARAVDLSVSAVSRVENADVTSVRTVLRACAYVGVHPFDYGTDVSRESTETGGAA